MYYHILQRRRSVAAARQSCLNTSVQKGRGSYVLPYITEEAKRSGCPAMSLNTSVQKGHSSYVLPYIAEEAKRSGCPAMLSKYLGTKRSRLICITIYYRGGEA